VNDQVTFLMPGDSEEINVHLVNKAPLTLAQKFIMREGNITIGAGRIIKLVH